MQSHKNTIFLPHDDTQSAVMPRYVVRLSVRPPVLLAETFRYGDHMGWNTSKIMSRLSLRYTRSDFPTSAIWSNRTLVQYIRVGYVGGVRCGVMSTESSNISEKVQDRITVG